jgi:hypothetical protein
MTRTGRRIVRKMSDENVKLVTLAQADARVDQGVEETHEIFKEVQKRVAIKDWGNKAR